MLGRHARIAAGQGAVAAPPAEVLDVADQARARAWARAERANLLACLDHAAGTGQHARVVAVTAALAALLWLDGPWAEAITRHTAAAGAARHCGDRASEAHALTDLANMQMMVGDYQASAGTLAQALGICRAGRYRPGEAGALDYLGMLRWVTGDFSGAGAALEQALAIHRDLGDRLGESSPCTSCPSCGISQTTTRGGPGSGAGARHQPQPR